MARMCDRCGKKVEVLTELIRKDKNGKWIHYCSDCGDIIEKKEQLEKEKNISTIEEKKSNKLNFDRQLKNEIESIDTMTTFGGICCIIIGLVGIITIFFSLGTSYFNSFYLIIGFLIVLSSIFLFSVINVFGIIAKNLVRINKNTKK